MSDFRSILNARGYEVGPKLGAGGEAAVYRVEHRNRHSYAVKVYQKPIDDDGALRRRFDKELQFSAALQKSQYLVRHQESFDEDGFLFRVWELADGTIRSLLEERQRDNDGSFSRTECQQLLMNVAKGLDAIDSRNAAHGDIKPENLLIFDDEHLTTSDPIVKIGDFGTSRIIESETTRYTDMRSPQYSLPGRHVGKPTRERDLFGLAVVYAELRLGRHPYGATSDEILKNLHTNKPQLDGLDDDEVAEIQPLLCEAAIPDSAVEWLTRLAPPQSAAGLPEDKILRSHMLDASGRLEMECKKRVRTGHDRSKQKPSLGRLVRAEPLFRDGTLMRQRGLSVGRLFRAIDVRNDVVHPEPDTQKPTLEEVEQAFGIIHDAADLLEGQPKRQWKLPPLPPKKEIRELHDDDDVVVTPPVDREQTDPGRAGSNSDPDLIRVSVPEEPHDSDLKVETVYAAIGSHVQEGDLLVSLDDGCPFAMPDPIRSPSSGWIHSIEVKTGSQVNAGDTVAVLSTAEPPASEMSPTRTISDSDTSPQPKSPSAADEPARRRRQRGGRRGMPVLIKAVVAAVLISAVVFYLRSTSRAIAIEHALDEFDFEKALSIDNTNPDALIARAESRLDETPPDVEGAEADLDQVESSDHRHRFGLEIARLKIDLIRSEQSGANSAVVADRKKELVEKLINRCLDAKVSVNRGDSSRWGWRQVFEDYRSLALLGVTYLDRKTGSLINDPEMPDGVREQLLQQLHPVYNSVGMEFRLLPAGAFTMGYSSAVKHNVYLSSDIFMGVYEITADQYNHIMGPGGSSQEGGLPVQDVSWSMAREFCTKLSALPEEMAKGRRYRLPTEAEWEYACRAGTGSLYSFGNDESKLRYFAWFIENAEDTPHAVGTKLPNAWGFHDMHGNVCEWCEDVWDELSNEDATDPLNAPASKGDGWVRVRRGGAYSSPAGWCRSGHRENDSVVSQLGDVGFRVVMVQSNRPTTVTTSSESSGQNPHQGESAIERLKRYARESPPVQGELWRTPGRSSSPQNDAGDQ